MVYATGGIHSHWTQTADEVRAKLGPSTKKSSDPSSTEKKVEEKVEENLVEEKVEEEVEEDEVVKTASTGAVLQE